MIIISRSFSFIKLNNILTNLTQKNRRVCESYPLCIIMDVFKIWLLKFGGPNTRTHAAIKSQPYSNDDNDNDKNNDGDDGR